MINVTLQGKADPGLEYKAEGQLENYEVLIPANLVAEFLREDNKGNQPVGESVIMRVSPDSRIQIMVRMLDKGCRARLRIDIEDAEIHFQDDET